MQTIKKCLNSDQLIKYYAGQLNKKQSIAATIHIARCDICKGNLTLLKKLNKTLIMEGEKKTDPAQSQCPDIEIFYAYLEGILAENETRSFEHHLNSCQRCLDEFVSLIRNAHTEISPEEKSEISQIRNVTQTQQIDIIMSTIRQECDIEPKPEVGQIKLISKWWEKIKSFFALSILPNKTWRYATAAAFAIMLLVILGYPKLKMKQSYSLTAKGIAVFTNEYMISSEQEVRPMGGFAFSPLTMIRRLESKSLDSVRIALEKAIDLYPKNELAHQYLGTYYLLIKNDVDKAKEHYQFVYARDSTNASILNDLGQLAFRQKDYQGAIDYFRRALSYNSTLKETQYNLALTYMLQGDSLKALVEWDKYAKLDPRFSWVDVARKYIDMLKDQ